MTDNLSIGRSIDVKTGEIEPANSKFDLTQTGLTVNGEITYDEWRGEMEVLRKIAGAFQWWIGDLLNLGEHKWGEKYADAVNDTEARNWQMYASVAARFEFTYRYVNLTWTHHQVVAYLEEPDRSELLRKAADQQWSVSELREAARLIKSGENGKSEPASSEPDQPQIEDGGFRGEFTVHSVNSKYPGMVVLFVQPDLWQALGQGEKGNYVVTIERGVEA